MDRLQYNELALEAMRRAAVKPATHTAVAKVNRCVEEMQKLRGHTAPPVDAEAWVAELKRRVAGAMEVRSMSNFKLVPLEPTAEMIEAAEEAYMPFGDMDLAIRMAVLTAPDVQVEPCVETLVEALTELCDEIDKHSIHDVISETSILWFKRKARESLAAHRKGAQP